LALTAAGRLNTEATVDELGSPPPLTGLVSFLEGDGQRDEAARTSFLIKLCPELVEGRGIITVSGPGQGQGLRPPLIPFPLIGEALIPFPLMGEGLGMGDAGLPTTLPHSPSPLVGEGAGG